MFSFGKKKEEIKITDVVFMKAAAKWNACQEAFNKDGETIFIVWFEETQLQLQEFFKTGEEVIYTGRHLHIIPPINK